MKTGCARAGNVGLGVTEKIDSVKRITEWRREG